MYVKTNVAKSDDMVRIASNQPSNNSALPGVNTPYSGSTYRSFIFELVTYHPFRFCAQVAIDGGAPVGTWNTSPALAATPDPEDKLEWSYLPNQKVDIELEITSFTGSDGRSADPFGTAFEVYIDAPMLSIDYSRLSAEMAAKLKPHATIPGRFVYTVDASREAERAVGNGKAVKIADAASTVSQSNERKTLPFITTDITSAGDIVISSQMDVVEFFEKRFEVKNTLIEGTIKYVEKGFERNIAKDEFVSFAVKKTGVRIGSMTITNDGHFALNLRAEYDFSWTDDELLLSYIVGDKVYEATIDSLDTLYRMTESGTHIVLN
jgi:hypothetical protein